MPTLRDVARAAGLSTTTVSDALAGRGRVTAATRARVAAVAREIGYSPNLGARHLRQGRTGAIGLVVPQHTMGLAYYMELAIGAAEEAHAAGLALTLLPPPPDARPAALPHVDGLVIADPVLGDPALHALTGAVAPIVTCEPDLTPGARHAGVVATDHAGTVVQLLEHLAQGGARRTALLCPGRETSFGHDIRTAYLRWCSQRAQEPLLRDVALVSDPDDVISTVAGLLDAPAPPDSVLTVPDGSGPMALRAVLQRGRRVPEDLLLSAYVDNQATHALQVTAVDLAPREMGRQAARLLVDVLAGRAAPGQRRVLPARIVARASTSRPEGSRGGLAAVG